MPAAHIESLAALLGAVRRHLWRQRFLGAARWALWFTAVWMAAAVVLPWFGAALPWSAGAAIAAVVWTALLARAAWQRPADTACALWADRHLQGCSAYSTLLGLLPGDATPAAQHLQRWAATQVPISQQLLSALHDTTPLARPAAAAGVSMALAAVVLGLAPPQATAPAGPAGAAGQVANVENARTATAPQAAPGDSAQAQKLAQALRETMPETAPETQARQGNGRTPAAGADPNTDGTGFQAAPPDAPVPPVPAAQPVAGARAADLAVAPALPVDSRPPVGSAQATPAGQGAGRTAGDSRDERADAGVSPLLKTSPAVPRSALSAPAKPALPTQQQADMGQAASYQDDPSQPAAPRSPVLAAAPATPPAATDPMTTRLSATEARYVQAWLQARAHRQ